MTMVMGDFRAEARTEAIRLARARALTKQGDDEAAAWLESTAAWMTSARRTKTRAALGRHAVMLWRTAFENADGAIVDSQLVAIALEPTGGGRDRAGRNGLKHIIAAIEPVLETRTNAVSADWQRRAQETARAFSATHAARRRAIATLAAQTRAREFQPGLFDRRAERTREHLAEQDADSAAAATRHLAAALSSEAITLRRPQLLLVLTP